MGIKDFHKFLSEHTTSAITTMSKSKLQGETVAVDVSIFMHRYIRATKHADKQTTTPIHFQAILSKLTSFVRHDIRPIFVFDGKPPDAKDDTIAKREEDRQHAKRRITKLTREVKELQSQMIDEPDTMEELTFNLSKLTEISKLEKEFKTCDKINTILKNNDMEQVKQILVDLGYPTISSLSEADPQCAYYTKTGDAFGVVSEDTDILVFGATNLIRGYNASCPTVTVYNLQKILQQLDVTMEQLIDIGILLGCDYTTKIPNLGPKKILQEIKKYNNIEGIIQSKKYIIPESFQYERARQHFQHPQLITEPLQWNIKSPDDTVRVLHNYGIDDYDTERLVQAMMLHMEVNMDSDSD